MSFIDVLQNANFQSLFNRHCIADGGIFTSNDEDAKQDHYYNDASENSLAFNDYLKKSYVFYRSDELTLGLSDDNIFLIDSENSLFLVGKNPQMLVNTLASDDGHYGFHDVQNIDDFNAKYSEMFGDSETKLTDCHVRDFFMRIKFE
jgi:CRISPR/Cas system Type II protein with McrA/HNH and RuvC-like nuclease domain